MLFTLFLFSCNETASKKVYKPQSSGNINSLLVVVDDDLWGASVGEAIRRHIGSCKNIFLELLVLDLVTLDQQSARYKMLIIKCVFSYILNF